MRIKKTKEGYKIYSKPNSKPLIFKIKVCPRCKNKFISYKKFHIYCCSTCTQRAKENANDSNPLLKKRKMLFNRQKGVYGCEKCGKEGFNLLHLHRKISRNNPKRNELKNVVVLCSDCHKKAHKSLFKRLRRMLRISY